MTKLSKREAAVLGVSRAPLTAPERAKISGQLTRRFAAFDLPDTASKADVIEALVRHLLDRQRRG